MKIVHGVLTLLCLKLVYAIWMPELPFTPNFDQFQLYKSNYLENIIYSSMEKDFQWQSISSVGLLFNKISYIIYGGSRNTAAGSPSGFPKSTSLIVICKLFFDGKNSTLSKTECSRANTKDKNQYLGVSIETATLSEKEAVIVYCDPLWHISNDTEPKPSGKCYLNFINEGKFERNTSIEFCRFSPTSFLSCLGGFSVDLVSTNKHLSELQMIVGMPSLHPYGRVKIIDDPFGFKTFTDPRNGIGKYFNFGYAVSSRTTSTAYASSPLSDHYGPNVTDIRKDVIFTSTDNINFSSFGQSLKTLMIDNGASHAVIIGAPFHPLKSRQNVGMVYVFCNTNSNSRSWLATKIFGEQNDEFFGYSLANIGDINGDGNEDLAISSPFIRHNDARGFVSIYTVSSTCTVDLKPQQILRNTFPQKIGIFGISVAGRSDLDFNNWPDIAVLNSRSNSIELYASRTRLKAQCKFSFDSIYETDPLKIDEKIPIKIFISLIDAAKRSSVDLDFLKYYSLISQINPNLNTDEKRFTLVNTIEIHTLSSGSISASFVIKSLMHVKKMNLTIPIIVGYRFLQNCSIQDCNDLKFPLIDWENCKLPIPARKYICADGKQCNADLSIELFDLNDTEVIYGYDKSFSRTLTLKISNSGPTTGKDINFKASVNQNLRIHKISTIGREVLKSNINQNQTESISEFEQEELEVNALPFLIQIEFYFVDFNKIDKMNFSNNFILIELISEVKDSNRSNNWARIDYTFLYAPNLTFSGSPAKETVVDPRNGTLLIRHGNRLAVDKLGPMLSHQYIVENSGNGTITNMVVKVSMPMRTVNGYRILYFFDKIRGINRTQSFWMSIAPHIFVGSKQYPCTMPDNEINPMSIIGFETHDLHLKNIGVKQSNDWTHRIKRRSADDPMTGKASTMPNENDQNTKVKMRRIPIETIHCDRQSVSFKSFVCTEMVCKVPLLLPHNQARLQINAWVWAHTFLKKQIADIVIYTNLRVDFSDIPVGVKLQWERTKSYSQSQHFIFQNFRSKVIHFKPWWPIILGIVVGILILAILIVAMYKCGFFRRKRAKKHFKPEKPKKGAHHPVIVHQDEMHTSSSVGSEVRMASHSPLIK